MTAEVAGAVREPLGASASLRVPRGWRVLVALGFLGVVSEVGDEADEVVGGGGLTTVHKLFIR